MSKLARTLNISPDRLTPSMERAGRAAYERDVAKTPQYHDKTDRPSWDNLSAIAKWSWIKDPTDR